jgi:hypothetical protein
MSTPMHKRELQKKIKIQKAHCLLPKMLEPISRTELERKDNVKSHHYQQLFNYLAEQGLIERAGERGRNKLWKTAKHMRTDPEPSLADAHFVYDADKYQKQHLETDTLRSRERKSPRVYVSGAQTYA